METDPTIWQAIMAALRGFGQHGNVDPRAQAARAASGRVAQRMPDAVMPHEAIEKQRQREALMDAILRGGQ